MEKKKSAIEKITLNEATFKGAVVEPTYVNFFYGKNGTGKSTIAGALKSGHGLRWKNGKDASLYRMLAYDTNFVNTNFETYDNLPGVFTVCKENIEIRKKLNDLNEQRNEKKNEYKKTMLEIMNKEEERTATRKMYHEFFWQKTAHLREAFDEVLTGKKFKIPFAEEVIKTNPREHDSREIEETIKMIFYGESRKYPLFVMPDAESLKNHPGYELIGLSVSGSSDSSFARFIKSLNATDWVRQGHSHFKGKTEGKCPYCQQILPEDFEKQIAVCFDKDYQTSLRELNAFKEIYNKETLKILKTLKRNLDEVMPELDVSVYKDKLKVLSDSFIINSQRIDTKIKEPTVITALEDTDQVLKEISEIIITFNERINDRNDIVTNKSARKYRCKTEAWEHLAYVLKDDIKKHNEEIKHCQDEIKKLNGRLEIIKKEGQNIRNEITALKKQTVSTKNAIDGINTILRTSGFQGFSIKAKDGIKSTYEVIRPDGRVAEKLSEGERNFIAFLYFYHLVKGSFENEEIKDKIVVIDDPVSSMDSDALFIVSSLVREMVDICCNNVGYTNRRFEGDYIKQIFILTHNIYFQKEVTKKYIERYQGVSLFLLRKSFNISTVVPCIRQSKKILSENENFNPVHNSYTALWDEYKAECSANSLINVIRRILEYYFVQLCGYDGEELNDIILEKNRDKFIDPDGKNERYHLAAAMLAYIYNVPVLISDGINYVDDHEDAQQYRTVFRMIFSVMQQEQHYRMMMNG